MRIGIVGGSFDPMHLGHLILAESVRDQLHLDRVIFIPAFQPPHKRGRPIASPEDRYKIVQLAVRSNPGFQVSHLEIQRKGISYTIDTLKALKKRQGQAHQFFFIAGADAVPELPYWRDVKEILRLARFVIATRPGFSVKAAPRQALIVGIPSVGIDSSTIRRRVREGRSIRYLVDEGVRRYMIRRRLYQ